MTWHFKTMKELAAHFRQMARNRRDEADDPKAKRNHSDRLRSEAMAYESAAHVVENTTIG